VVRCLRFRFMSSMKRFIGVFKAAASNYSLDKVPRLSASLAYYTVFSMSPLFVLVVAIAGIYYGAEEARTQLFHQIKDFIGEQGAGAVQSILAQASKPSTGKIASLIAGVTLLL